MSNTKTSLKDFSISGSIHGIKNLTVTKKIIPKLIWLSILLLSASYCSYAIYSLIDSYFKYEVVSNIGSSYKIPIKFPAVSICYDNTDLAINNTLLKCKIGSKVCNSSDFFKIPSSQALYGMDCYTINQGKNSSGHESEVIEVFNTFPLDMVFYLNNTKYLPAGLNIMIHDQERYPTQSSIFTVPSGFDTTVLITKKIEESLPEPYSHCGLKSIEMLNYEDLKSHIMKFNQTYNQESCVSFCFRQLKNTYCEPNTIGTPICIANLFDGWEDYCLGKCPFPCVINSFVREFYFSTFPNEMFIKSRKYLKRLPIEIKEDLEGQVNFTHYRETMLKVAIKYKSLETLTYLKSAKMDAFSLLGNIGGLLGCFLGASFISLAEIVEVLIKIAVRPCERKNVHLEQ